MGLDISTIKYDEKFRPEYHFMTRIQYQEFTKDDGNKVLKFIESNKYYNQFSSKYFVKNSDGKEFVIGRIEPSRFVQYIITNFKRLTKYARKYNYNDRNDFMESVIDDFFVAQGSEIDYYDEIYTKQTHKGDEDLKNKIELDQHIEHIEEPEQIFRGIVHEAILESQLISEEHDRVSRRNNNILLSFMLDQFYDDDKTTLTTEEKAFQQITDNYSFYNTNDAGNGPAFFTHTRLKMYKKYNPKFLEQEFDDEFKTMGDFLEHVVKNNLDLRAG